ncbi:zinc finger, CCHC-type containing protein [Tanacetum coccineum]
MQTVAGDGVTSIKRRRRDQSSDGVRNMATASGRGRLKEDLESSTWRRRLDYKATPSQVRPRVDWWHVVWYSQCNPKQALMAIQGKLLTQDIIMVWQNRDDLKYPLCKSVADSHVHLFFDCPFSFGVWKRIQTKSSSCRSGHNMNNIVTMLSNQIFKNNTHQIVDRLILSASVCYIWMKGTKGCFKSVLGLKRIWLDEVYSGTKAIWLLRLSNLSSLRSVWDNFFSLELRFFVEITTLDGLVASELDGAWSSNKVGFLCVKGWMLSEGVCSMLMKHVFSFHSMFSEVAAASI